jgi:TRAP-type mannitol/chloroaromatic compound transport system permease small subunit
MAYSRNARHGKVMTDATLQRTTAPENGYTAPLLRTFALGMGLASLIFVANNYLIYWRDWPGPRSAFTGEADSTLGLLQIAFYVVPLLGILVYAFLSKRRTMRDDSALLSAVSAFIIRWAFWTVLLVGFADAILSFIRIEGYLEQWVGLELSRDLGVSRLRGAWVHFPLTLFAGVIALFTRSISFIWLSLLVVVAEFQIVISRFIFSYEQAFMGDLVRFWYAALFLFASAYTLVEEGHVRVDVLYSGFSDRGKAWCNTLGSLFLGLPLCWVILVLGLGSKAAIINSPILAYETSQSGFGMYTKYMMAGFLAIFALSMLIQFMSYMLDYAADLRGEPRRQPHHPQSAP